MINAYINQDFLKMYFKLSKRALAIDFKCKIPVAINLTIIKIKKKPKTVLVGGFHFITP